MRQQQRSVALTASIAGCLGVFVGAGLLYYGRLPEHTIDLLVFTESAFGICVTLLALIISLVLIQQRQEVDQRLEAKSKEMNALIDLRIADLEEYIDQAIGDQYKGHRDEDWGKRFTFFLTVTREKDGKVLAEEEHSLSVGSSPSHALSECEQRLGVACTCNIIFQAGKHRVTAKVSSPYGEMEHHRDFIVHDTIGERRQDV